MCDAFARHVENPYPRLIASRRGIRAPRVVKAFALWELAQPDPDFSIIDELLGLFPAGANIPLFAVALVPQREPAAITTVEPADETFDDGQSDRAFESYLRLPASREDDQPTGLPRRHDGGR